MRGALRLMQGDRFVNLWANGPESGWPSRAGWEGYLRVRLEFETRASGKSVGRGSTSKLNR